MQRTLSLLPVLLTLLAVPQHACAQVPDSLTAVLRHALDSGWHLRLASARNTVDGRVVGIDGETVRLVGARIPVATIERIDRLRKQGGGALAGGLVGGLGFGLVGVGLSSLCEVDCDWEWAKGFALGAGFGGITGALIGQILTPARRRWDPIWP